MAVAFFQRVDKPISIESFPFDKIYIGTPFHWTPTVINGLPPYKFEIDSNGGTPLDWFIPNSEIGDITATPNTFGSMSNVIYRVTDNLGRTATISINLDVVANDTGILTPTRFVDFENGDDGNFGITAESPWKRAPGDPLAEHGYNPVPGDVIAFKGGVRYNGRIICPSSGTSNLPITYAGNLWGDKRAVLDGSKRLPNIRPASNQADAGGIENWQEILIVEDSSINYADFSNFMDDAEGILFPARYPEKSGDPIHYDEMFEAESDYIEDDGNDYDFISHMADGWVTCQELAERIAGQEEQVVLAFWTTPNAFAYRRVDHIDGNDIYINSPVTVYQGKTYVFVLNDRHSVTKPGMFSVIDNGKAIFYPRQSFKNIRILGKDYLTTFNGKDYIGFDGFTVTGTSGFAGDGSNGVQVFCSRQKQDGSLGGSIASTDNFIRNIRVQDICGSPEGTRCEAMDVRKLTNCKIENITFDRLMLAGGMNYGRTDDFIGQNISIQRAGRTALRDAGEAINSLLKNVILSQCRGVHANGITAYAAGARSAEDTFFDHIVCFDCDRPFTAQGNSTYQRYGLTYNKCVGLSPWTTPYMATVGNLASVSMRLDSNMNDVTVKDCILISAKVGLYNSPDSTSNTNFKFINLTAGVSSQTGMDAPFVTEATNIQIVDNNEYDTWESQQTLTSRYVKVTGKNGPNDIVEVDLRGIVPEEELIGV